MTPGRLRALVLLAFAFLIMLVKKVFGRGPRGLALFEANFRAEGLASVSAAERAEIAGYGRCIACGRCDVGDGARIVESGGVYPGTMALMVAASRGAPDLGPARRALAFISDEELAKKEQICPARVPMRRIAAFVRAR